MSPLANWRQVKKLEGRPRWAHAPEIVEHDRMESEKARSRTRAALDRVIAGHVPGVPVAASPSSWEFEPRPHVRRALYLRMVRERLSRPCLGCMLPLNLMDERATRCVECSRSDRELSNGKPRYLSGYTPAAFRIRREAGAKIETKIMEQWDRDQGMSA